MLNVSSKPAKKPLTPALSSNAAISALPWGVPSAGILLLLCFILLPIIAQIIITSIPSLLGWDSGRAGQWAAHSTLANFLYVLLAESLTTGLLAWFIVRRHKTSFLKAVGLRRPQWMDVGYGLVGAAAYVLLFLVTVAGVSALLPLDTGKEQALGFDKNIGGISLFLAFVSLVILPPIVEEMVFRGFFYGTLRARNIRVWVSVLVTSLVFGSLHLFGAGDGSLLWIAFVDTFVLSVVLCSIREYTGSIWSTMLIHSLKNGFVFLNLFILHAR